jgi:hypothetical protein
MFKIAILTSRKSVVIYGNTEKSHPISKTIAEKFVYNRIIWMIVIRAVINIIRSEARTKPCKISLRL